MHRYHDDISSFFFFQAEDGIRDLTVTGVQTCALPISRLTLERLITDGRIHPQRIEDAYERGKTEIEQLCKRAGEDALVELGITDMHPELVDLLGRLRYRTSYGQNVLKHLVESAHIAGMMASELGLDPVLMKRCTVLHDIGKALTHEVQGSHALIGAEIARRYGEHEDV